MSTACTVVRPGETASARVLTESFLAHEPTGSMTLLALGDPAAGLPEVAGARVVGCDEIGLPDDVLHTMVLALDEVELAHALTPWLVASVLAEPGTDHVLLLGADSFVVGALAPLADLAREHGVVLTARTDRPVPSDGLLPDLARLMALGPLDEGLVAFGPGGRDALDWWRSTWLEPTFSCAPGRRTRDDALQLLPAFFAHHLLTEPAWAASSWNLAGRRVERTGGVATLGSLPVRTLRMTGHDPASPHLLDIADRARPRVLPAEDPVLRSLCAAYDDALARAHRPGERAPVPFGPRGGIDHTGLVRDVVRNEILSGRTSFADPDLGAGTADGLVEWLHHPRADSRSGLGVHLDAVLAARPDVAAVFTDPGRRQREDFLHWCSAHGVAEMGIPEALIERARAGQPPSAWLSRDHAAELARPAAHGIEVVGMFTSEYGLGESARQLVAALETLGVDLATTTDQHVISAKQVPWQDRETRSGNRPDVVLVCTNADGLPHLLAHAGPALTQERHVIGLWYLEIASMSDTDLRSLELVDEVWTMSQFCADTIRRHTDKPVTALPHPVHVPASRTLAAGGRESQDEPYTFLFVFDHSSCFGRKNPLGLVEAYERAFPTPDGRTRLVVKTNSAHLHRAAHAWLVQAADRPDIEVLEANLPRAELDALFARADCYVSLHRAEGLGLTLAEAMLLGKPVIATGWSGNLEFTRPDNSYLVDHTSVPVGEGNEPYDPAAEWAEPDLDHAAALMRHVLANPEEAARTGAAGRDHVAAQLTGARFADVARRRLSEIWADLDARAARG